jgi:hypothetical protein
MSKALMGSFGTPRSIELLDQVRALRARVAKLEEALAEAEAARDARVAEVVNLETPETVSA